MSYLYVEAIATVVAKVGFGVSYVLDPGSVTEIANSIVVGALVADVVLLGRSMGGC